MKNYDDAKVLRFLDKACVGKSTRLDDVFCILIQKYKLKRKLQDESINYRLATWPRAIAWKQALHCKQKAIPGLCMKIYDEVLNTVKQA